MARQKTHQVKKAKDDKRIIAGVITVEDQRRQRKAAQREALKEAGMLTRSGAGVHGDDKKQSSRRNRRDWKQRVARGEV